MRGNFHGSNDIMVLIRKVQLAESKMFLRVSLPQNDVIMEEKEESLRGEVGCALEGSGIPMTETGVTTANLRGNVRCSPLLDRASGREPKCSGWLALSEPGGFMSVFAGYL